MFVLGIPVKNEICVPSSEAEKFVKVFVNNGQIEKIEYVNSKDLVGSVYFFITPKEEYVFDFLEMGA